MQQNTIQTSRPFNGVVTALVLFWLWVGVQFLNPWGLGILPSLAGLKMYFVPALLLIAILLYSTEDEIRSLPYLILGLGLVQGCLCLVEWFWGSGFLVSLHPKYAEVLLEFIPGLPYRPFGSTPIPGGPSVWLAQTLIAGLIVISFQKDKARTTGRFWITVFVLYIPVAMVALIACQVRLTLVRFIVIALIGLLTVGRKQLGGVLITMTLILAMGPKVIFPSGDWDFTGNAPLKARIVHAVSRAETLQNLSTYQTARSASWYWKESLRRADSTLQGVGLSRISAASRPWVSRIKEDPYFGDSWRFADNLYLAIFTELGIGGLISFLALAIVILYELIRGGNQISYLVALNTLVALLAGYAAEGVLYQPDASLFWLYVGLGLRLKSADSTSPQRTTEIPSKPHLPSMQVAQAM